jgi:actin-related protein
MALGAADYAIAAAQATRRLNEKEAAERGSSLAAEAEARAAEAALEALEAKKRWDDPGIYDRSALVLDCGSCLSRGGRSGDVAPAAVVRTVAAKCDEDTRWGNQPWHGGDEVEILRKKVWERTRTASKVTDAALDVREPLTVGGLVGDWDAMEEVWRYFATRRLCRGTDWAARAPSVFDHGTDDGGESTDPLDGPSILVADATLNTAQERERRAEIMFESIGCRALCTPPEALLALYSEGRTTGLVVDIGHDVTHVVPVVEGLVDRSSAAVGAVGGVDVGKIVHFAAQKKAGAAGKKERGVKGPPSVKAFDGLSAYKVPEWVMPDGTHIELPPSGEEAEAAAAAATSSRGRKPLTMRKCTDRFFHRDALHMPDHARTTPAPSPSPSATPDPAAPVSTVDPRLALRMRGRRRPVHRGVHSALLGAVQDACAAARRAEGRELAMGADGETRCVALDCDFDDLSDAEKTAARDLWANVVLCGGGSMLPGLIDRLGAELKAMAKAATRPGSAVSRPVTAASVGSLSVELPPYLSEMKALALVAGAQRQHAVWRGGAMLSELDSFRAMWIRKSEWEEHGDVIVRQRQM